MWVPVTRSANQAKVPVTKLGDAISKPATTTARKGRKDPAG